MKASSEIKILIVEDEHPAAQRLSKLILAQLPNAQILQVIDSVEDAISWFRSNDEPDLAFFDIQLADGISFNIFEEVKIKCPIIFTTAYDQYAIKAFKVNAIDYLLKPIDQSELALAIDKFQESKSEGSTNLNELMSTFLQLNENKNFKERFLIKKGDQFKYITADHAAYFYSEDGYTFLVDVSGNKNILDDKMDSLDEKLNPRYFFRINRKYIIHESAVKKIESYFNSRLILDVAPKCDDQMIVARDRVSDFKAWLNA